MRALLVTVLVLLAAPECAGLMLGRNKPQPEMKNPEPQTIGFTTQLANHLQESSDQDDQPSAEKTVEWEAPPLMSLDGCRYLYLDLGSNRGGNIRALFQENLMTKIIEKTPLPEFMAEVGDAATRGKSFEESGLCAIAFEGNPLFRDEHKAIETAFNAYGWRMQFMSPAIVLDKPGNMTFFTSGSGDAAKSKAAGSSIVSRGEKNNHRHIVQAVDFPKFVQDVIVPARSKGLEKVVMHMDVESAEYLILPKMAEGRGLCQDSGLSKVMIEWHRFTPKDCVYCNEKAVTALMKKAAADKDACTLTEFTTRDFDMYNRADHIPLPEGHA